MFLRYNHYRRVWGRAPQSADPGRLRRSDDKLSNVECFGSPFSRHGFVSADDHERVKSLGLEPPPTRLRGEVLHQQIDFSIGVGPRQRDVGVRPIQVAFVLGDFVLGDEMVANVDMARIMESHPDVAVLFCNVLAPPYDRSQGYVPAYQRTTDRRLSAVVQARNGLGLGAGMALRRQAMIEFGGLDETFGPGARFASGDDWDISLRAMLRGWHVYDTAELSILHHGFRTLAQGRAHALRDWVAIGALCAKPIRAGHVSAVTLAA